MAPPMPADEETKRHLASSCQGDIMFQPVLASPGSMQASGAQLIGDPLDVSAHVSIIGMTPAGTEMPKRGVRARGYKTLSSIPVDTAATPKPQIRSNNKRKSFKGSWTIEEDRILRDMVLLHGENKWSVIAKSLPGRIGKQCRERWINQVNPNIKENAKWTVEEDMVLIQAHKSYGQHWSTIASFLPGRPENRIKNHWNSTERGLKRKLRLKMDKSEQVPLEQLSILEEYILSLKEGSKSAAPQPPSPPVINPRFVPTSSPEMEMHLNSSYQAAKMPHQPRAMDLRKLMLPDLNISYDPQQKQGYPMDPSILAPQLQVVTQNPQQTTSNWVPFLEPLRTLNREHTSGTSHYVGESSSNVAGTTGYYNEAGSSNISGSGDPAGDTSDVLELASREFLMPSSDEVSLGLARFK